MQPRAGTRVLFVVVLLVAAAAHWPALRAPLVLDDFAQRAMIEGRLTPSRNLFDLFDFVADDNRASLLDRGVLPWWSDPLLKTRFLRPLPSLLVWLDYELSGYHSFAPHLRSLFWWAVAVAAAGTLFRSVLSERAAAVGTLVFALSPAHTVPIWWLANRDVLVSVAVGSFALARYVRWRHGRSKRDGAISTCLWAAAMLTGEYALCFTGYVAAIEFARRGDTVARRMSGLAVFALPLFAYLGIRAALGYGVHGSGFYHDPLADLGSYISGTPRALAILLGAAWFGIDDRWSASASLEWLVLVGAAIVLAMGIARASASRRQDARSRSGTLWLLVGSVLALLPVAAVQPSTRLLAVGALGVCALVGVVIDAAWTDLTEGMWRSREGAPTTAVTAVAALGLVYAHFIHVPVQAYWFSRRATEEEPVYSRRLAWVRENLSPSKTTVVVLRGTTPTTALAAPFMLRSTDPERWRVLTQAFGRLVAVRSGSRSLDVVQDGAEPLVYLGPTDPVRATGMAEGETFEVPGMRTTVVSVDGNGQPGRLRFEFDRDLDAPSFWWIVEGENGFREVRLPSVNQGVRLLR
ncbi:MAG: hypothetical protein ABSF69_27720 [Polyangiaceae bacterium]